MVRYFGKTRLAGSLVVACVLTAGVSTQSPPDQKQVPKVKSVRAVPIASVGGEDNFTVYCAVCHGPDGRGDGPAAPAIKAAVPDLTTIAKRNNGKFDPLQVEYIIKGTGKTPTPAHGVEDMPIWGDVFRGGDNALTTLRVANLVKYVESIQQAATARR